MRTHFHVRIWSTHVCWKLMVFPLDISILSFWNGKLFFFFISTIMTSDSAIHFPFQNRILWFFVCIMRFFFVCLLCYFVYSIYLLSFSVYTGYTLFCYILVYGNPYVILTPFFSLIPSQFFSHLPPFRFFFSLPPTRPPSFPLSLSST